MDAVTCVVRIERKSADLPAYVTVPAARVAAWGIETTTTVEGSLGGVPLGRRSLKRWDSARWFIELPRAALAALGKSTDERATLVIRKASDELPAELSALLAEDAPARARWEARSDAQRRMLREDVLAAKTPAARERRARRALAPPPAPKRARVAGLGAEPREILVRILARRLPGRDCGPYSEVAVGFVEKVGCHPLQLTPANAREARWETRIEVRRQDGAPRFRGPAVNGPPDERFLYLTWIGRLAGAAPAMFRRAKLRLDAVPPQVLAEALKSQVLVGRLELTADDGMPLCASVRPPAIAWSSS